MELMQTAYPDFVPNQVLTSNQLNHLRTYLDQQTRRSRVRLVGAGIACGLECTRGTSGGSPVVMLSAGFGVTSDGHLVEVAADTTYDHWRPYVDPDHDEQRKPAYAPWGEEGNGVEQIDLIELLDSATWAGGAKPDDARKLTSARTDDRMAALYLERSTVDLDSCLVTDCDNEGRNEHLTLRLVMGHLPAVPDPAVVSRRSSAVAVPRFHTKGALTGIRTAGEIDARFRAIVDDVVDHDQRALITSILDAFAEFGPYLGLDADADPDRARESVLVGALARLAEGYPAQSSYDFVRDLATAHEEMLTAACGLLAPCASVLDHPRHLMLAFFGTPHGANYRHGWYPSAVAGIAADDRAHVRNLFRRVMAMAGAAGTVAYERGVRMAPSHAEGSPLGDRAIPLYYEKTDELRELWRPQPCGGRRRWEVAPANDDDAGADDPIDDDDPIDIDYSTSSMLRIEGDVGLTCHAASTEIAGLAERYNVEIDLVPVHVEDEPDDSTEVGQALAALADNEAGWAPYRARVSEIGPGSTAWQDAVEELESNIAELRGADDAPLLEDWRDARCTRPVLCDTSHLQADYLQVRAKLLCVLGDVEDVVEELNPREVLEEVDDPFDTLSEGEAELYSWIVSSMRLRSAVAGLRRELPKELCRFSHPTFVSRYGTVGTELAATELSVERLAVRWDLVAARATGIPRFAELASGRRGWPTRSMQGDDTALRFWQQVAEQWAALPRLTTPFRCLRPAVDAIDAAHEALRNDGSPTLSQFAARAHGLEHIAGVEKGGTFVLVCEDDDQGDAQVVADLSLAGKVACCRPGDARELCLPPVAAVVSAVSDLEWVEHDEADDGEAARYAMDSIEIDLLAPNGDADDPTEPRISIALDIDPRADPQQITTELGGTVEWAEEGAVVRYHHARPTPGAVDRFGYEVVHRDEGCGRDRGHVLVLLRPPDHGSISGQVTMNGNETNFAEIGVRPTVRLTHRVEELPVDRPDGRFAFDFVEAGPPATVEAVVAEWGEVTAATVDVLPGRDAPAGSLDFRAGGIRVRVRNNSDVPKENHRVELRRTGDAPELSRTAWTEADGLVTFPSLPIGRYHVWADRAPGVYAVGVRPEDIADVHIVLLETGSIHGELTIDGERKDLAELGIAATATVGDESQQVRDDGGFDFTDLDADDWWPVVVRVDAWDMTLLETLVEVNAGEATSVPIDLQVGWIDVTVTDQDGDPVAGHYIALTKQTVPTFTLSGQTDSNGSCSFPTLPIGGYHVTAPSAQGDVWFQLEPNEEKVVPLVVHETGSISGVLTFDGDTRDLAELAVTATVSAADRDIIPVSANGRFSFDDVQPGDWTVTVDVTQRGQVWSSSIDVDVEAGREATVQVPFELATLTVNVGHYQGDIAARRDEPDPRIVLPGTIEDGTAVFSGLPPGEYAVLIEGRVQTDGIPLELGQHEEVDL